MMNKTLNLNNRKSSATLRNNSGLTDFAGVAATLGHVKDLLVKIIDLFATRRDRQLNTGLLEEQLRAAQLKNVREQLALLEHAGFSQLQRKAILLELTPAIDGLEGLAERGLITHATIYTEADG